MYDVFFISYGEPNCEENWERLLTFHPEAKRVDQVKGIDVAHMMCHDLSTTDKFWTVDGDNWLLKELNIGEDNSNELIMFDALDPIDNEAGSMGSVKLWPKGKLINTDMSKGDFCMNATEKRTVFRVIMSEHRYNADMYTTWKNCFRHMVKNYSGIIIREALPRNTEKYESWNELLKTHKAGKYCLWGYQGYLDAHEYYKENEQDMDSIKRNINDYDFLKNYFETKVKNKNHDLIFM